VTETELKTIGTQPVVRLREEVLAMVHMQEALDLGGNDHLKIEDSRLPVVVVEYEGKKIGLGVDRVIGTGEIVIKSLSRHYREIEGLIGASILGNGKIALIVDVEAMVRLYHHADGDERAFTGSNIFNFQARASHSDGISGVREPSNNESEVDKTKEVVEEGEAPKEGDIRTEEYEGSVPPGGAVAEGEEIPESGDNVLDVAIETADEPKSEEQVGETHEEADGTSQSFSPEELAQELSKGTGVLLEEIHNTGAIQASMSISQLTGQEIRISFPESQIVTLREVANNLGGEEAPVGGIYVGLTGELAGGMLIVLPQENLFKFHELLYQQPSGTCTSLEEVDLSGISELGNILSASFINAISNEAKLGLKNETPEISVDMCLSVIDSVLARFNQPGEHILLTKALLFSGETEEVVCHLLLFLEPESLQKLMDVLNNNLG